MIVTYSDNPAWGTEATVKAWYEEKHKTIHKMLPNTHLIKVKTKEIDSWV